MEVVESSGPLRIADRKRIGMDRMVTDELHMRRPRRKGCQRESVCVCVCAREREKSEEKPDDDEVDDGHGDDVDLRQRSDGTEGD